MSDCGNEQYCVSIGATVIVSHELILLTRSIRITIKAIWNQDEILEWVDEEWIETNSDLTIGAASVEYLFNKENIMQKFLESMGTQQWVVVAIAFVAGAIIF